MIFIGNVTNWLECSLFDYEAQISISAWWIRQENKIKKLYFGIEMVILPCGTFEKILKTILLVDQFHEDGDVPTLSMIILTGSQRAT